MDNKMTREEALNIFLTEIFKNKMAENFPEIKIAEDDKGLYFKLWCSGVRSGMELDLAIQNLKETGEI